MEGVIMIVGTIIATVLSAWFYRLGGLSKEQGKKDFPWLPDWVFNTKARDVGCTLVSFGWMILFFGKVGWYVHPISFGLMFASLTTYFDEI